MLLSALTALFDNLVGEVEHPRRHGEAERPGGLEIDDQRPFGWLLNREVGRAGTLEDAVDVGCGLSVHLDSVEPLGHQRATPGEF